MTLLHDLPTDLLQGHGVRGALQGMQPTGIGRSVAVIGASDLMQLVLGGLDGLLQIAPLLQFLRANRLHQFRRNLLIFDACQDVADQLF